MMDLVFRKYTEACEAQCSSLAKAGADAFEKRDFDALNEAARAVNESRRICLARIEIDLNIFYPNGLPAHYEHAVEHVRFRVQQHEELVLSRVAQHIANWTGMEGGFAAAINDIFASP